MVFLWFFYFCHHFGSEDRIRISLELNRSSWHLGFPWINGRGSTCQEVIRSLFEMSGFEKAWFSLIYKKYTLFGGLETLGIIVVNSG